MASGLVPKTSKTLNCLVNSTLYIVYGFEKLREGLKSPLLQLRRSEPPFTHPSIFERGYRQRVVFKLCDLPRSRQHAKLAPKIVLGTLAVFSRLQRFFIVRQNLQLHLAPDVCAHPLL